MDDLISRSSVTSACWSELQGEQDFMIKRYITNIITCLFNKFCCTRGPSPGPYIGNLAQFCRGAAHELHSLTLGAAVTVYTNA